MAYRTSSKVYNNAPTSGRALFCFIIKLLSKINNGKSKLNQDRLAFTKYAITYLRLTYITAEPTPGAFKHDAVTKFTELTYTKNQTYCSM